MSTEALATFSNQAVAAATVVFGLAWLLHMAEWASQRRQRVVPERELVAAGGHPAPPADDAAETDRRTIAFARTGIGLTVLAELILITGVIARGLAAERVPWGNMYEFAITGVALATAVYLVLVRLYDMGWLGPLVTGFVIVALGLAWNVYVPVGPLVPALHSYWLVIHVSAACIAGGAFTVGAALSVLYLVKSRAEERVPEEERRGYLWQVPSSAWMDRVSYKVHAFAFPVWTFAALIAGPIWAHYAWSRYWGWDPKEVWAFITWVVYAVYLHARATVGWRGRAAAVIALVGFATFLFDFVGVNLFFDSIHAYAK